MGVVRQSKESNNHLKPPGGLFKGSEGGFNLRGRRGEAAGRRKKFDASAGVESEEHKQEKRFTI